jgi:DNA-binding NarL/FixJ family response regulator
MGLRQALQGKSGVEIAGEAASGRELFALLETQTPDLILLDIKLPDRSGLDIARQLKHEKPEIKILLLSAEDPKTIIETALAIGVEGYITKAADLKEVENAVVSILNGLEYFGSDIAGLIYRIVSDKKKGSNSLPALTERETEIVSLCSEGLLAKEVANQLHISLGTVNRHKANIFSKLGINNRVELARYAYSVES